MQITTINDIQSIGSFESSYGTMYKFQYALEDGTIGESNHKSQTSPFKVGQEIAYEIQGKTPKGAPKLKLSKPDGQQAAFKGSKPSAQAQTAPAPSNSVKTQGNGSCGPTIGMCVRGAIDICLALKIEPTVAHIHAHAWDIMQVVKRMEEGVAPSSPNEPF